MQLYFVYCIHCLVNAFIHGSQNQLVTSAIAVQHLIVKLKKRHNIVKLFPLHTLLTSECIEKKHA